VSDLKTLREFLLQQMSDEDLDIIASESEDEHPEVKRKIGHDLEKERLRREVESE
jgi:hypothetical protein